MNEPELLALMARFRTAYASADRAGLLASTSANFTWHQHFAVTPQERPTGKILRGIDELMVELQWRQQHWQDTRYENLKERAAGDLIVQTFTVSGREDGVSFHADAVDLYPVQDGLITRKDTYWKYLR